MERTGFEAEDALIDKYVELKESGGDCDLLIKELVLSYFIPQKRLVEAESWLTPVVDSKIKALLKKALIDAEEISELQEIVRMPKNRDWMMADIANSSETTSDQQYHYNRTICMSNFKQVMLDDRDDVFECRNEWITFVAKNSFVGGETGGLGDRGAQINTIAMAYHDYIEQILLPEKFIETDFHKQIAEETRPQYPSVEAAYGANEEEINYLRQHHPQILNDGYLMNFYAYQQILGKQEEIIVTENYVAFLPAKKRGWSVGDGFVINRASVNQIYVGTEYHTEYQGITSSDSVYWTLTFETNNFQQFTRYLYLGRNEREMNSNRPDLGRKIQRLGEFFALTEGDSFSSTGGYKTTFGYGWWIN